MEVPEAWDLGAVSGSRESGYALFSAPNTTQLHIRWEKRRRDVNPSRQAEAYLSTLKRDAKRRRIAFEGDVAVDAGAATYKWSAERHAVGAVFWREACNRVFFVEVSGPKGAQTQSVMRAALESFRSGEPGAPELWCVLGLRIRLPFPSKLHKQSFLTGMTQLHWTSSRTMLSAGRSAFGADLVRKHGLEGWARSLAPYGQVTIEPEGVRIESRKRTILGTINAVTLAKFDEAQNQLTHVNAMFRDERWRPDWRWFDSGE